MGCARACAGTTPAATPPLIGVRFLHLAGPATDELWASTTAHARGLTDFVSISEASTTAGGIQNHRLVYSFSEVRLKRMAAIALVVDGATNNAAVLEASFVEEEKDKALKSLDDVVEHLTFAKAPPGKDHGGSAPAGPGADAPGAPAGPSSAPPENGQAPGGAGAATPGAPATPASGGATPAPPQPAQVPDAPPRPRGPATGDSGPPASP